MQYRFAVNNLGTLDAIHTNRQVIHGLCVRLNQRCVYIEVRCHIFGNKNAMSSLLIRSSAYPFARDYTRAILNREQRTATGRLWQIDRCIFAHLIVALVEREREHCGSRRVAFARMSSPIWPINVYNTTGCVPAYRVLHIDQVFSPRRVIYTE